MSAFENLPMLDVGKIYFDVIFDPGSIIERLKQSRQVELECGGKKYVGELGQTQERTEGDETLIDVEVVNVREVKAGDGGST
jgi:hypothetical protein